MPSFKIIGLLVLEKKILKDFAVYRHGDHLGHVTLTIYMNFHSLFLTMLHMQFGFDWPSDFREEDVRKVWTTTTTTDDGAWLYYKLIC